MNGSDKLSQTLLSNEQLLSLKQLSAQLSPLQLAWASGYLAAHSETAQVPAGLTSVDVAGATQTQQKLTVLYGSQTGNAKGVATKVAAQAKEQGLEVVLANMSDYKPKNLKQETHMLIVVSTNGEGEAPDDAMSLHEFLVSKKAPKLENLNYSVLALGDSSYEFFCQTGKDFDERLANLGAKSMAPRVDCDVDYQDDAAAWSAKLIAKVGEDFAENTSHATGTVVSLPVAGTAGAVFDKENPLTATLSTVQKITGRDSAKDVRHIEIDLGESGLTYTAGDALGVWQRNDPALVGEIIALIEADASTEIAVGDNKVSLSQALVKTFEVTLVAPKFVEFWADYSQDESLLALVEDKTALREYCGQTQLVDVLKSARKQIAAQEFVGQLRKLTPRLYSIASSQTEVEEEVHLTVGMVAYEQDGVMRYGSASGFLGNRLEEGEELEVFIEHNDNFRLPENDDTPIIMVGPGTGIAPFRAFMQERDARDAEGDNWLFFGDQTFTQDFLYQTEWQGYLKSGLLTRIDLAFSRDQEHKIYVQDRLRENAKAVYEYLENGAHIYICGDMSRMAKDVHQALADIIAEQGGKTAEQAEEYLKELRNNKRYQKDVY